MKGIRRMIEKVEGWRDVHNVSNVIIRRRIKSPPMESWRISVK